ncbi:MAG: DUF4145 domain-containing protein [Rhodocyclales bacterium]|nr:DUF4145 domain-containing protein [Rhodocyclales bacterium]
MLIRFGSESPTPSLWTVPQVEKLEAKASARREDDKERGGMLAVAAHFRRLLLGEPFIDKSGETAYNPNTLENVFISNCYTCGKPAIWLHDRLLYPPVMTGPSPNPDLSEDVQRDYEEARRILELSPRGAAALLRLAIEKICIELRAEGKDINQRIAFLVSKGLPVEVQQALDAVRVIGNEAVHPGQVDIRDDRETATKLFGLVNYIANDRITRPKQIAEVYGMIPEEKRKAIDDRNAKATNGTSSDLP